MRLVFLSLALAIGAMLLVLFRPAGAPTPARDVAMGPAQNGLAEELRLLRETTDTLARRITDLEMEQRLLAQRSETRATREVAVNEAGQAQEPDPVAEKLRDLVAALENPDLAPTSDFQSLVVNVLEARERDEEAEREERRREFNEARISERVADLTESLGLSLDQSKGLHRVMTNSQLRRDEVFDLAREDGTFDRSTMRDSLRTIRDESRTELQTFLAPDQYDRYIELEESDRRGFFGGGGRGGGPGDGGPDGGGGGGRGR